MLLLPWSFLQQSFFIFFWKLFSFPSKFFPILFHVYICMELMVYTCTVNSKQNFLLFFFFCVCKNCFKTHETGVAKLKTGIINFDSCFCIHNFWKSQNISGDWTIINTHNYFLNYNIYNFHRRSPYLSLLTWNISTWRRFLPAGWCLTGNGLDEGKYPWNNPFITRKPTVRHNIKVEGWCCAKIQKKNTWRMS